MPSDQKIATILGRDYYIVKDDPHEYTLSHCQTRCDLKRQCLILAKNRGKTPCFELTRSMNYHLKLATPCPTTKNLPTKNLPTKNLAAAPTTTATTKAAEAAC